MAEAEESVNSAIIAYRDALRTEEARAGSVVRTALIAAAPWAVDVHVLKLTIEVDLTLPVAADRVKVTESRIEPRWPAALKKAAAAIME